MTNPQYAISRRRCVQVVGAGVVGSALPAAATANPAVPANTPRAQTVLIVHLSGGPSQLDLWDMKPEAPAEIRGEFQPIDTVIPGISICEHMPKLAQQMNRWSIIRTLSHPEHNHLLATHVALTGRPKPVPRGSRDLDHVESRSDFPNIAAALNYVQPRNDGIPTGVSLPNYFIEGPLTWPGQHAGFLGPKHDPWQISQNPNDANFRVEALSLQPGLTPGRLFSRRELLDVVNGRQNAQQQARTSSFAQLCDVAFSLLTSAKVAQAFQIERESAEVRDRYGRTKFGQSLLLARRLAEAGVPVIQAAMGIVQTWDTHVDNWGRMKKDLLPALDAGLAALMDDLSSRGLLEKTVVVVMGEFGRTPRISTLPGATIAGRDHWAWAYSALFAGGDIRGGQAIGETDAIAAYPLTRPWSPADVLTTLYDSLGVDPEAQLVDPVGRPNHLMNGVVIEPLYSGKPA